MTHGDIIRGESSDLAKSVLNKATYLSEDFAVKELGSKTTWGNTLLVGVTACLIVAHEEAKHTKGVVKAHERD